VASGYVLPIKNIPGGYLWCLAADPTMNFLGNLNVEYNIPITNGINGRSKVRGGLI
jgi:hypothetical protein